MFFQHFGNIKYSRYVLNSKKYSIQSLIFQIIIKNKFNTEKII